MFFAALGAITPVLMYFDVKAHRLPNTVTYTFAFAGLLNVVATHAFANIVMAGVVAIVFGFVSVVTDSFGMGDTKLLIGIALWLGAGVSTVLVWASGLAGVLALWLLLCRNAHRSTRIPFGPFLLLGAWVAAIQVYP